MAKKIGIMGGTFNPIHNGHLLLAENARETYGLDAVIFMPSGNSYMKDTFSMPEGSIRAHMVELALEGNPYFFSSHMEVVRKGPTYTCDTLKELKERSPANTYYFIMGADNLLTIENWRDPATLLRSCTVIAATRGTGTKQELERMSAYLISKYQADIRLLPVRFLDISSSEIRQRIRDGMSARYMLPDKVLAYIETNRLYQPD